MTVSNPVKRRLNLPNTGTNANFVQKVIKNYLLTTLESYTNASVAVFRIAINVQHLLESSGQLAALREPKIRAFEVADGVLRLRDSHEGALPLADLALDEAAGEVDILGVRLRPASSGVGENTLKRYAISASVQRAIAKTVVGVNQNSGYQSPDVAAVQAIRGVLGKLDRAAPEGLSGVLYSRNLGEALASGVNNVRDVKLAAGYVVGDLFHLWIPRSATPAPRAPCASSGSPNSRFKMPLPKNPEDRKKVARAVVSLMKLPPPKRKEVLHNEMRMRGLTAPPKAQAETENRNRTGTNASGPDLFSELTKLMSPQSWPAMAQMNQLHAIPKTDTMPRMKPTALEMLYSMPQEQIAQPDPLAPGYLGTHTPPAPYLIHEPQPVTSMSTPSSVMKPPSN